MHCTPVHMVLCRFLCMPADAHGQVLYTSHCLGHMPRLWITGLQHTKEFLQQVMHVLHELVASTTNVNTDIFQD